MLPSEVLLPKAMGGQGRSVSCLPKGKVIKAREAFLSAPSHPDSACFPFPHLQILGMIPCSEGKEHGGWGSWKSASKASERFTHLLLLNVHYVRQTFVLKELTVQCNQMTRIWCGKHYRRERHRGSETTENPTSLWVEGGGSFLK